jgi:protein dithiol:quinone oxidoreductase
MRLSQRAWLLALALLCVAVVGAALVTQHVFDMLPCPWCILQRLIFLVIALLLLAAALLPGRALFVAAALLFSLAGVSAALYQHFVAAKSSSCNLTLADRIIGGLGLDKALPPVFEVKASCADAAVELLRMPYEFWSLTLFVAIGVGAVMALRARSA